MRTSHCIYPFCGGHKRGENYFRIPEKPELRKKWMAAIPQVQDLTRESIAGKRVFLCANHFEKSCFNLDEHGRIIGMKETAVPSIFYIPTATLKENKENSKDDNVDEEEGQDITASDIVPPPPIPSTLSDAALYLKARDEEFKLLVYKEKMKKEQEEFDKAQDQIKNSQKGVMSKEVEETYLNLIKKLRPIAPKKPPKRRPKTLEEVIIYLRKERMISEEAITVLLRLFADVPVEDKSSRTNDEAFQCFAQYMSFYNTEVYENIDSHFDINPPSISLIRQLYNSSPGEPGWSNGAFNFLKKQAMKGSDGSKVLCSLLVTTFSIKRKEEWDGKKMRGYVDCGPWLSDGGFDVDCDALPTARSVLTLMAVPLNPRQLWRVPLAYFYTNRLTSVEKANIIRECILRLFSMNTVVLSVTSDVFSSDKTFLNSLGVSFDLLPHICPYFVHPADPLLRVHVIFDPCSLLSSVQNMWSSSQSFQDKEGRVVSWKYVSELIKLHDAQANSFNNTIDAPMWSWDSLNARNRLLAQLFSDTVADALDYFCNELRLAQFEGCEATVNFIRIMSRASKLLQSRRFVKIGSSAQDEASLKSEYRLVLDYLYHLKNLKGEPLHSSKIGSIRSLYLTLMSCQELLRQVNGFSSHCVSLNEVELIFYIIRTYTGWCSMPTARQFTSAFTSHVEKNNYSLAWTRAQTNSNWWVDSIDVSAARREGCLIPKPDLCKHVFPVNFSSQIPDEGVQNILEFRSFSVSNFVGACIVKTLSEILHCETCLSALQDPPTFDNPLLCLLRKTCGAVICPSKDVLRICARSEHYLNSTLRRAKLKLKRNIFEWDDESFVTTSSMAVASDIQENGVAVFPSLNKHVLECSPDSNHLYRLVRGISSCYVLMRLRGIKSWCPT